MTFLVQLPVRKMLPVIIMKEEKVSNVNIFKNTFSKSKLRSPAAQYSSIILNKGQKNPPHHKVMHLWNAKFISFF